MSHENQKKWKELLLRAARIAARPAMSMAPPADLERVEAENRILDAAGKMTAPHERQFSMESCNSLLIIIGRASVVAGSVSERGEITVPTIIHTYN